MNTQKLWPVLAGTALAAGLMAWLACTYPVSQRPASTASARPAGIPTLPDHIAHELATASPLANPADARARDAAGDRLSHLTDLLDASQKRILWGGFDEKKGYNPAAYRLTAFSPEVWVKLYLSTFMFPGDYHVRTEGRFTVLEIAAKFRDGLDSGDYPYPFWHSAQKWQAYVDAVAVLLVFEDNRLVAAFRKAQHDPAKPFANKPWDGRWTWKDANGHDQPRVVLYSYLLSPDNPHAATLDAAFRKLEENFRQQHCLNCHAPDNRAQADPLFLLNFPNQALSARHTLAAMLRGDKMPPPDGIAEEAVRGELIRLAEDFEREADTALAYETSQKRH